MTTKGEGDPAGRRYSIEEHRFNRYPAEELEEEPRGAGGGFILDRIEAEDHPGPHGVKCGADRTGGAGGKP